MTAYLQLGHNSLNLLDEEDLKLYGGVVISPVNDDPTTIATRLAKIDDRDDLDIILDPQLYNPYSERGKLSSWGYFPSDFETALKDDKTWWFKRASAVLEAARELKLDAACSPAFLPKKFSDAYYSLIVSIADQMKAEGDSLGIDVLITVIVKMSDLSDPERAQQIASILTASDCDRVYLFFLEESPPKEPLRDSEALPTAVHLIRLLSAGMRVQVAFCGHDAVMWKFAGAADVTSGKFLNLRRFTPGRWGDEESEGRQVSYWNEGSLLTLLRGDDVMRLHRAKWYEGKSLAANPYAQQIMSILLSKSGQAWQKLSWCQYLRWLANIDAKLSSPKEALDYLKRCIGNWKDIEESRILLLDNWNDGLWVRVWANACNEGASR